MDALTKKAVAAAREGRWQLLDAMELLERAKSDITVVCLAHQVGDLALIGHCEGGDEDGEYEAGGDVECTFCDGEGDLEVQGRDGRLRNVGCPVCDGHGVVERDDEDLAHSDDRGDVTRWRRLDGQIVELAGDDWIVPTMTITAARKIVKNAMLVLAGQDEAGTNG